MGETHGDIDSSFSTLKGFYSENVKQMDNIVHSKLI